METSLKTIFKCKTTYFHVKNTKMENAYIISENCIYLMTSKMTGAFLVAGPILLMLIFAVLWPGGNASGAEALELATANVNLTYLYMFIAGTSMVMIQSGLTFLSKCFCCCTDKANGDRKKLLQIANILAITTVGLFFVNGGLILGSLKLYLAGDIANAVLLDTIANNGFDLIQWSFGVTLLLVGAVAIVGKHKPKVAQVLVLPGALMVLTVFSTSDSLGFGSWIIMSLALVATGASILLDKDKDKKD